MAVLVYTCKIRSNYNDFEMERKLRMTRVNLNHVLLEAREQRYAVGAFNIFNHLTARAVIQAAEELKSPLILQTSTSTVKFYGVAELGGMLVTMAEAASVPVVIHLDHCTDLELAKECLDNGWSSVMFDGSKLSLDENIRITKEIVRYARQLNATVEGELGAIVGIEEDVVVDTEEAVLADIDEAKIYVDSCRVDAFAPAIGTAHGLYKGKPVINFELFSEIESNSPCPCVIHGGTGLEDEVFKRLISLGASKINISTAIKIAYFNGLKDFIAQSGNDIEPLKLDEYVANIVKKATKYHLTLFGSENRV